MPKPQCIQYLRERIKIEFQSQSKEVQWIWLPYSEGLVRHQWLQLIYGA